MHYYHHRITTIYAVLLFVTVFAFGGQKDDRRKKTAISYKNIICVQAGISNRAGQTVRIMMRLLMIMTSRRRRGRRRLLHWRICPEAATLTLKEFYRVQCEGRPGMRPWNHDKALPAWPCAAGWLLDEASAELNCNLSFFYYYGGLYLFFLGFNSWDWSD